MTEVPMMLEREFGMPEHCPAVGVGFVLIPQENPKKSAKAGHPVFEDVEFVKIVVPGDRQSDFFQPATDAHKKRFPRAYEAFLNRETKPVTEGMPIEEWPQVSRSLAMTLKAANIYTVEALAEVHDGLIDKIGNNGRDLREKAKAFLRQSRDSAAASKFAEEKRQLQDQITVLQQQVQDLISAQQKRGPGRPPKAKEDNAEQESSAA